MTLTKAAADDELSEAELHLVDQVFEQYGHLNNWELRDLTHEFGEWTDPHGGSIQIGIDEILHHLGKSGGEVAAVIDELRELETIDSIIGSR